MAESHFRAVYTSAMRRRTIPIGIAVCLCFLSVQFSGLHMHVDAEGYVGVPEIAHTHSQRIHDRHDAHDAAANTDVHHDHGDLAADENYEGTRDVSVNDLTLSSVKVPLAILVLAFLFSVIPLARALASPHIVHPVLSGRYTRWRPPLRAPPQLA